MSVPEVSARAGETTESAATAPAGSAVQTAKAQAVDLGNEVGSQAKSVAGEASQQARATVDEARNQARRLARQTQDEVLAKVDDKSTQAAAGLQSVAGQLQAVADGRTDEAGPFAGYAQQAADRIGTLAERLQTGGARGVVDDVTDFARRRPGLFLVGAVGAGFLAGRLVRSGKAAIDEQDSATSGPSSSLEPPTVAGYPVTSTTPAPAAGYEPATVAGYPASAATGDIPPLPPPGLGGETPALTPNLP
jgi:hypothetical protein